MTGLHVSKRSSFQVRSFVILAAVLLCFAACITLFGIWNANANEGDTQAYSNEEQFTLTSNWQKEGREAKVNITASSAKVERESVDADVIYICDLGGNYPDAVSIQACVNYGIGTIKEQNPGSRFAYVGFSGLVTEKSDGFKSTLEFPSPTIGTFSNWSLGFNAASEMIDDRDDDSRPIEVIFITQKASADSHAPEQQAAFDNLNSKADNFKIVSPNNAADASVFAGALGKDNLFSGSNMNMLSNTKTLNSKLMRAVYAATSDRVNVPVRNVSVVVPLKEGFSLSVVGQYQTGSVNCNTINIGNEASSPLSMKISSSYVPSGFVFDINFVTNFGGTPADSVQYTDTAVFTFSTNDQTVSKTQAPTSLGMMQRHVSYNVDGGSGQAVPVDSKTYYSGMTVYAKSGALLVKEDASFAGWIASSQTDDHETVDVNGTQFVIGSSDITLKASYSAQYVNLSAEIPTPPSTVIYSSGYYGANYSPAIAIPDEWRTQELFKKVSSITFKNTIDVPDEANYVWPAGSDQRNGVTGWSVEKSDGNYDVFYGAKNVYPSLPTNCNYLLYGFSGVINIDGFENLDSSNVEALSYSFCNLKMLKTVNLSKLNPTSLKSIDYIFDECNAITEIDLSSLDTKMVTSMKFMFFNAKSLNTLKIDPTKFNTSNVTSMASMFRWCSALKSVPTSKFDTKKVEDMSNMFFSSGITSIDLKSFSSEKLTNTSGMFEYTNWLTSVEFPDAFDFKSVTNTSSMFNNAIGLESIKFSSKTASTEITNASYMFYMMDGYSELRDLDLSKFNFGKNTNWSNMLTGVFTFVDREPYNKHVLTIKSSDSQNIRNLSGLAVSELETGRLTIKEVNNNSDESAPKDNSAFNFVNYFKNTFNDPGIAFADELIDTEKHGYNLQADSNASIIPEEYKQTVEAGEIVMTDEPVVFTIKLMNFGQMGNSGNFSAVIDVPDGLRVDTDGISVGIVTRIAEDMGPIKGKLVSKEVTATQIKLNVTGLSAGAYLPIEANVYLDEIPATFTRYDTFANYQTIVASGTSNYVRAFAGGSEPTTVFENTISNTGEVPSNVPVYPVIKYAQGETVILPEKPIIAGYTTGPWVVDGEEIGGNTFTMPSHNTATTLTWTKSDPPATYSSNFKYEGTEPEPGIDYPKGAENLLPDSDNLLPGSMVHVPEIKADLYPGWTFKGWKVNTADFLNGEIPIVDGMFEMPASQVEVVGSWEATSYNVLFTSSSSGPTSDVVLPTNYTLKAGDELTWPVDAKWTGTSSTDKWTFAGWNTSITLEKDEEGNYTMPMCDVTFEAQWDHNQIWTLSFNKKEHGQDVPNQILEDGEVPTYPGDLSEWDWKFGGWFTSDDFTEEFDFTKSIYANTTAYAKWTATTYTVYYETYGGPEIDPKTGVKSDDDNLTGGIDPERKGYDFEGWFSDEAFTNEVDENTAYSEIGDPTNDSVTIYAKYEAHTTKLVLKFPGCVPETIVIDVTYDQPLPDLTNIPTRDGYEFGGIFDENGVMYYDASGHGVRNWDKDETEAELVAKWNEVTPEIVNGNGTAQTGDSTLPLSGLAIVSVMLLAFVLFANKKDRSCNMR